MRKILLVAIAFLSWTSTHAQPSFSLDSMEFCGYKEIYGSDWGDIDNDGDLDFLVVGRDASSQIVKKIYNNNGSGTFTPADIALPSVTTGAVALGDYDMDGDLDILFNGNYFGTYYGRIYRNNGGNNFSMAVGGLKGLFYPACKWGDYDNDGDLDIIMSGKDDTKAYTIIYRNDKGSFTNINADLIGVQMGKLDWADFDNDGDLDLIVAGYDFYYAFNTKVYRNDGNDKFKDMDVSLEQSFPKFFDYNSDGKLDILSGYKVYKNVGDTTFTDIGATMPMGLSLSSSFCDYDNDGDLDILNLGFGRYRFYRYDGGTTYFNTGDITTDIRGGETFWCDYNNDGKRDYLITYQDNSYKDHIKLFKNTYATANTAPTIPSGFSVTTKGSSITIHWTKSTDSKTPQNGIHYNVRIGTTKSGVEILDPQSNLTNGFRKITGYGNCASKDSFVFKGLIPGKYYFNVQALDNNFLPSAFSPLDSFIVPQFDAGKAFGFKQLFQGHIAWGDYDNDGDMDALVNGTDNSSTAQTLIYQNKGNNTFLEINASLKGIYSGYTEWGDYDNDGDLDIALCGNTKFTYPNFQPVSKIYRNDGSNVFVDLNLSMEGIYEDGKLTWGDYDNDGKPDLLLCGTYRLILYHNDGGDKFTKKVIDQGYTSYFSGSWADIDNDNDLDFAIISTDDFFNNYLKVYKNDGTGTFTNSGISIKVQTYFQSYIDWADFDNDGDLDLGLSGDGTTKVFRNDAGSLILYFNATDSIKGQMKWGDYDNDGDPDIISSGAHNFAPLTFIYRNDNGTFTKLSSSPDNALAEVSWIDIDNDKDLDISMITGNNDFTKFTKLILTNSSPDNLPSAPTSLSHSFTLGTDKVILKWKPAADIDQSNPKGLSYNLWVRSIDENKTILDPMADKTTGYRLLASIGNAGTDTSYYLRTLSEGKYEWKVQAIDHAFQGSVFSTPDTFKIGLFSDNPSDITLCAGDTITVRLRLDGLAVAGDNVFVAQLSDPYGYFDVPTQIAAVAGTQSGNIQVAIPGTALAGIKYKIRFLTTSPRYTGIPEMPFITINPRPQPMISGKPIVCQKDIGIDYKTYSVQGNTYSWNVTNGSITSGQNTAQILVKWGTTATGKIKVTESNTFGCVARSSIDIIINPLPTVSLGKKATVCKGTPLIKNAGSFYAYSWSSGEKTQSINITKSGNYFVQITDDNGCKGYSDTLAVTVLEPFNEQICMVTLDSTTGKNLVVWEKTPSVRTVSYKIYKISGTSYKLIGSRLYKDLSIFRDSSSTPDSKVDRYAITTIDSCGNESVRSPYHQTMLLQAAKGTSANEAVLSWNKYLDEAGNVFPEYYYIYKGKTLASLTLLDSVSGLLEPRFNDQKFDGISAYYRIAFKKPQPCDPADLLKAESGPYTQTLSNIAEFKPSALSDVQQIAATIYPNPFNENLTIALNMDRNSDLTIEIENALGEKTAEFIYQDLTSGKQEIIIPAAKLNISQGVCYVKMIAADRISVIKCLYIQ